MRRFTGVLSHEGNGCGSHLPGCLSSRWNTQVMYECNLSQSETLAEAVPEAMKNVLLVMATRGVLSPAWTVSECESSSLHAQECWQHAPCIKHRDPTCDCDTYCELHALAKSDPSMVMLLCCTWTGKCAWHACSKSHSLRESSCVGKEQTAMWKLPCAGPGGSQPVGPDVVQGARHLRQPHALTAERVGLASWLAHSA